MLNVEMKLNNELQGIELYFNDKPTLEIRNSLKSNGFRWSGFKKCWYAKQSDKAFKIAKAMTNNELEVINTQEIKKEGNERGKLSLWDATQWENIEVNNQQSTKEIAKEIRQHIRKRFPQCKFSITSDYNHIYAMIKQSPYEKDSIYIRAVQEYVNNLINAYKVCYDAGDPYTDLPARYNFYFFNTSINYDYIQTELTEDIKKDMKHFDIKQLEHEKAEEERKEKEFQEWQKQKELEEIAYKKQQEIKEKQVENIYNNINVKSLENNGHYYIIGAKFANLNKNNTLDKYKEEVQKGDYSLENVKIVKEVHFNNEEALNHFSNMLLTDFDFLEDAGGSYTEDYRINSMTDFYNLDDDEKNTIQWNLIGAAVYYNNQLQFVIDTQGYSYARYVGLTDNATIEKEFNYKQVLDNKQLKILKEQADQLESISTDVIRDLNIINTWENENWKEYKEAIKEELKKYDFKLNKRIIQQLKIESLKTNMYKLLQEVDGIQEQFKEAELKQGDKLTLFYISDWGGMVTSRITFDNFTSCKYAQYDKAVRLEFIPERKRKLHYEYFHSKLLVYKGWYELPEEVLHHVEHTGNMKITRSKYYSTDDKQYNEILSHFEQQDIKPIINTYKPLF